METDNDLVGVSKQLRTLSGFDSRAFNHLVEDTNPNTVLRILARFCVSLNEGIPALERGSNSGEAEIIWKTAHKLAGSAEMLGFKDFGRRSKDLSWLLQQNQNIDLHFDDVNVYLDQARQLSSNLAMLFPNQRNYL